MMMTSLEVLFTPAEFDLLPKRDLSQTVCVVFDVLRATSSMMTALAGGAAEIIPVAGIPEALAVRQQHPGALLAGERDGVRIRAELSGGVDFDLGNSPREFTPEVVRGRTLVVSTTNGTRALRACARARRVLIGSFLNLRTVAGWIQREKPADLMVVCSGTYAQTAYEDVLAAGGLCDLVWEAFAAGEVSDSARMARQIWQAGRADLMDAMRHSRNGRRLLAHPELHDDVRVCLQNDSLSFIAELCSDGVVRRV